MRLWVVCVRVVFHSVLFVCLCSCVSVLACVCVCVYFKVLSMIILDVEKFLVVVFC